MGYTNKTSHYDLPQWIAGDKPSWLGDVNTAMLNIDTAIAGADASATAAESSAAAANAQVQAQEAKITKNTTDIQALTESLADTQGEVTTIKATANGALPKSGGTMTGNLILNAEPTSDLQAATKKYVDNSMKGPSDVLIGTTKGSFKFGVKVVGGAYFINGYAAPTESITSGFVCASTTGNPFNITPPMSISLPQCGVDLDTPPANATQLLSVTMEYHADENKTVILTPAMTANHHYYFAG